MRAQRLAPQIFYTGVTLWYRGYPEQAFRYSREALTLARQVEHPLSLATTLVFVAIVRQLRREEQAAGNLPRRRSDSPQSRSSPSGERRGWFYGAGL